MAKFTLHQLISLNVFKRCFTNQTFFVHSNCLVKFKFVE